MFKQARKYLVGGVNSPVRAFNYVGGKPPVFVKGKASRVFDKAGASYIDYVLSFGVLILGHAYPAVVQAAKKSLNKGLGFGATSSSEVRLARLISEAIPVIDKIRFVNSGTEAVMGALRLARGYTGKNKIVKFKHAYHGHADYLLTQGGSGLATANMPLSKGVPTNFFHDTLVAEYGNVSLINKIFKKYGNDIAAVIVEPVGANYRIVHPDKKFIRHLRKITKANKSLLVFDEIITGFRFGFSSFAQIVSIRPDLICLGKIIGGGLPIGAYGGSSKIMKHLSPEGEVYQASTFAGSPLVMETGIATLKELSGFRKKYITLAKLTKSLAEYIQKQASQNNVKLKVDYYGTMFSFNFGKKEDFRIFYKKMLKKRVYLAPSEYEVNFLSFAHTGNDITYTKQLVKEIFSK